MKVRENCWEHKKCGRQEGGENVEQFGLCPTSSATSANNINGGKNGGRVCWSIAGTFNGGELKGTFTKQHVSCLKCEFLLKVKSEENECDFSFIALQRYVEPEED